MKADIRREVEHRRAAVTAEALAAAGAAVARRVLEVEAPAPGARVAAYLALPGELPTAGLLAALHARGCRLFVPAWRADRKAYGFCAWTPETPMARGPLGIAQPAAPAWAAANELDLALVPLVAFDRRGTRLGHGGGHYDRMLAGVAARRVGLALACQEWPDMPREPHDVALHAVVTEREAIACGAG